MTSDQATPPARPKTVAFVDDNILFLERVRRNLLDTDWDMICFCDAYDALDQLREDGCPEVLFVDNLMPRLDGLDFLKELLSKVRADNARLFLCSAIALPADICSAAAELGVGILSKDVLADRSTLLETLDQRTASPSDA